MAKEKKLRIRLLSYDHRLLDESAKKIVEACKSIWTNSATYRKGSIYNYSFTS